MPTKSKKSKPVKHGVYINLLTDFGFKRIFGTEANKDLLIDFLNLVLKIDGGIKELNFINTETRGSLKKDRTSVFDLHCTTGKNERIIIEVQNHSHKNFKDRGLFYLGRTISELGKKGKDWNFELPTIYSINITNFKLNKKEKKEDYISEIMLTDIKTGKIFYKKLKIVYIELPRFKIKEEDLKTDIERWIYFFKNIYKLKKLPEGITSKIFKKLFEQAKIANMTPEELNKYNISLKKYLDMNVVINEYKEKLAAKDKKIENITAKWNYEKAAWAYEKEQMRQMLKQLGVNFPNA